MKLKQTALYNEHIKLGARMAAFAGWEVPLNYGSQIAEHTAVREDAGMFDVSHMNVVDIQGIGAGQFLLKLLANNVAKLNPGNALYSCMLNDNAGIIDDIILYYIDDSSYRMIANAATHDKDLAWLQKQSKSFNVKLSERSDLALIAIQGPHAISKTLQTLTPNQRAKAELLQNYQGIEANNWWIARTGYTGEEGYEIMLPTDQAAAFWQKLLAAGIKPCGFVARDSLRLEAGMRLYGADMDEETSPIEAGISWSVDWDPFERDFIGRKNLEQLKTHGVTHKLFGLILEKEKGILRAHQKIITEHGEGEITSGGFSPTLDCSIALAKLPVKVKIGDHCQVIIRNKEVDCTITKSVFARKGRKI